MKWDDAFVLQDLKPYEINMKFSAIKKILNGKIGVGDNLDGVVVVHTFPALGVDNLIFHNLGVIPTGYIVMRSSNGGVIYDGVARTTIDRIFLRSTSNNHTVTLFIAR